MQFALVPFDQRAAPDVLDKALGVPTVGERVAQNRIIGNESGRQDNGSYSDLVNLWLLLEINRACGTKLLTRCTPSLLLEIDTVLRVYCILEGNGLGIWKICGLPLGQACIVDICNTLRTFFCTGATGDAQIRINVPGRLGDRYLKVACITRYTLQFRQRKQLNVGVPADPDQFRRENSHGTLVGRKRLVKLCHGTTNGRRRFDQVDMEPGRSQVQSTLHAGYSPSYHHNRPNSFGLMSVAHLTQSDSLPHWLQVATPG